MKALFNYLKKLFKKEKNSYKKKVDDSKNDYILIKNSDYFDSEWYCCNNKDVTESSINPLEHYLNFGWKEGRLPSVEFNSDDYLNRYTDVKESGICPLIHFLKYGKKEGRYCIPLFSKKSEQKFITAMKEYSKDRKILLFTHELSRTGAPIAILKIAEIYKKRGKLPVIVSPIDGPLSLDLKAKDIPFVVEPLITKFNISVLNSALANFEYCIVNTIILITLALRVQNILPTLLYIHEAREGLFDIDTDKVIKYDDIDAISLLSLIQNVACVSEYAKSIYQQYCKKDIFLIRNYVEDFSKYKKIVCCDDIESNIISRGIKIYFLGQIVDTARKNLPFLIDVFRELKNKYPNIELHLVGYSATKYAKYLQQINKEDNNSSGIFVDGELKDENLLKHLQDMDILVVPSIQESCSLALLEAASMGKCILFSENVGAKYIFEEGSIVKDIEFSPQNKDELKNKLEGLLQNPKKIEEYAQISRKAYERNATEQITVKDLTITETAIKQNYQNIKDLKNDLTIIVPVYNAAEKLRECIKSICKNTQLSSKIRLLIIDDKSPEIESVRDVLEQYRDNSYIDIIYNEENLGYTKNINKAIKLANTRDVILLNSDTVVTEKWVEKIQDKAYLSESIGTVTPVSNSAGVFSVPKAGTNKIPPNMSIEKINTIVEKIGKNKYFEVPTGNGFCFYIKREVINSIGLFDEDSFPRGFGEENDFSMRALKAGFKNIVTLDTYIFHHEHCSFLNQSNELIDKGVAKVISLYPDYLKLISVFNNNDVFNCTKKELEKFYY